MASSLAVIPWNAESNRAIAKIDENSRPEGGRWALFFKAIRSPTSGRTMDQVYTTLGKALEMQANRAAYAFGLGPQVVAQKIKVYFGKGEETIQRLELLATTVPPKLEKRCLKLMKYALLMIAYIQSIQVLYLYDILGDMGETRFYVVNKLCFKLVKVFKDLGVDILALGLIEESELPFDYEGVDVLATNLLTGVLSWFNKLDQNDWAKQQWYESFKEVVQLLCKPRAGELLPCSSAFAASHFEEIFLTVFQDAELKLVVDGENETTHPPKNSDDSLSELECKCNSTTSLHSAISDEDEGQLSGDENDPHHTNSDRNSLGSSESIQSMSDEPDSYNSDMEGDKILDVVQTHLEIQSV
ncbi:hypothetical protein MSAN_00654000 [Mycena sanguinolenta]|uniref:Uncharacterized protein n=1 Tax=Mycena sanguinolenta TaxID=230812 RepID=A0A8H6Z3M4_9AGAR|nr:hypothetical protein MSAN_00654000 [Mycena sanguinolenta]